MSYKIDQSHDDSHRELYTYLTGINLPSYVKEASLEEICPSAITPKTAYADSLNKWFPVNTKSRVYVSNAFFVNKLAALQDKFGKQYTTKVAAQIKRAAELFNITEELEEYNKTAEQAFSQDYKEYDITVKIAETDTSLFMIKTASDVTRCAKEFTNTIHKYPFEWRRSICEQFVKAAEELGIDELPDLVLKYAGQYYPDIVNVKDELTRRAHKLPFDKKARYNELKDDVANITDKDDFFKVAEICYFTEKNAGLYDKAQYRTILGDPVDKIFTLHATKVAELLDTVEMGGEIFASSDLKKVSADVYHQAFGFELDPNSKEAEDILPTLPKSDVCVFKELSGIRPL